MSVCILFADTRPWGIYQVFFLHVGIWDCVREQKRVKKKKKKNKQNQTRLIVMLNLWVNDTITMPTPAIAMETGFIASTG